MYITLNINSLMEECCELVLSVRHEQSGKPAPYNS